MTIPLRLVDETIRFIDGGIQVSFVDLYRDVESGLGILLLMRRRVGQLVSTTTRAPALSILGTEII